MKIKNLLFGVLTCTALVGCSNDDDPAKGNEGTGESYVAINVMSSGGASSRGDDGGYEAGTGAETENDVTSALFVFFGGNDDFVEAVEVQDLSWTNQGGSPNVENISNPVIVLEKAPELHKQVIAILNSGLTAADVNGKSLTSVLGMVDDYSQTEKFVMSNSAYYDAAGNDMTATALTASNIASSQEDAKKSPINIYVERVLAKVVADQSDVTIEGENVTLNQKEEVTLKAKVVGYKLTSKAGKSHLVKNIPAKNYFTNWTDWNSPTEKRSFWADSYEGEDQNYEIFSWKEADAPAEGGTYTEYVQENTSATPTQLMLMAQIYVDDEDDTPETILKYKGTYYTVNGFKTIIASALSGFYIETSITEGDKTTTTSTNDWSSYIGYEKAAAEDDKAWEVKPVLVGTFPASVKDASGNAVKQDDVEKVISGLGKALCWTEGKCYFYTNIEHFGIDNAGNGNIGIVRNHVYKLDINKIKGLGTPVFDPDADIETEKVENEDYYVAATINILKWKIVNQEVEFE